jgi:hypothetical protein
MSQELVTPKHPLRVIAPLVVALVAVAAVMTGMTPPAIGVVPAGAPVATVPATPSRLPAAIEQFAEYEGQTLCTPATKSGVQKLVNLIRATYGQEDIGVGRSCSDGGQSEHKEGRAIDWMIDTSSATAKADAQSFLTWLLATDKAGNTNAMARRLGIMYIGWNNKMWRGYDPGLGWTDLKGCSIAGSVKNKSAAYNTYCHRNHIHLSLSWDSAQGATSFWTGKVTQLADCSGRYSAVAWPSAGSSLHPRLLVDTATGVGTGAGVPCRVGVDRWTGDDRSLKLTVPVPTSPGAYVFRVRVERYSSNAPGALLLDTTATTPMSVSAGAKFPYTAYLPISPDGKVTVAVNAGDGSVRMVGLGVVRVTPAVSGKAAPKPTAKAQPTITQTLPSRAKPGTTFTISGNVTVAPAGATVRRYLKVGTEFKLRGTAIRPVKGTWRMPVAAPSRQVGRYIYRIALVSNGRIIAWSPVRAIMVR